MLQHCSSSPSSLRFLSSIWPFLKLTFEWVRVSPYSASQDPPSHSRASKKYHHWSAEQSRIEILCSEARRPRMARASLARWVLRGARGGLACFLASFWWYCILLIAWWGEVTRVKKCWKVKWPEVRKARLRDVQWKSRDFLKCIARRPTCLPGCCVQIKNSRRFWDNRRASRILG